MLLPEEFLSTTTTLKPKSIHLTSPLNKQEKTALVLKNLLDHSVKIKPLSFPSWVSIDLRKEVEYAFLHDNKEIQISLPKFKETPQAPLENKIGLTESFGSSSEGSCEVFSKQKEEELNQGQTYLLVESYGCSSSESSFDAACGRPQRVHLKNIELNIHELFRASRKKEQFERIQFEKDLKTAQIIYQLKLELQEFGSFTPEQEFHKILKPKIFQIVSSQRVHKLTRDLIQKIMLDKIENKNQVHLHYRCYQQLCKILDC